MTPIKIHGVPLSVHTRKVILAAKLKQIPWEIVPVVPVVPDSLPANWREISPTGLIPAIEDADGFRLADSTAICLYLERRAPEPALLPPGDREAATVLFLDSWAGSNLFRGVMRPLFHEQVVHPNIRKVAADEALIKEVLAVSAPEAFTYLERRLSGPFLVAGRLTLADLAVVSNLVLFHYLGHRLDADRFPKLEAYFQAHLEAPVLAAVLAAEQPYVEGMGLDRSFLLAGASHAAA